MYCVLCAVSGSRHVVGRGERSIGIGECFPFLQTDMASRELNDGFIVSTLSAQSNHPRRNLARGRQKNPQQAGRDLWGSQVAQMKMEEAQDDAWAFFILVPATTDSPTRFPA